MAAYPTLPQLISSRRVGDDGTVVERADSGKARLRSFFSQVRYAFVVEHEVEGTDKTTLLSHYAADRFNIFSFTWKGDLQSYNVRYVGTPQEQPVAGNDRWRITNTLVVV